MRYVLSKFFVKKQEDFKCENCGAKVKGDGYTNHCPNCLFSKHVDVYPGDRASPCKGLMEPIGIEKKHGDLRIVHRCLMCGYVTRVKRGQFDNDELIIELSKNPL